MTRKFYLRSSLDLATLRARWRSGYSPAEAETLAALADVEKDIEDCDAEVDRLQAQTIFFQNQRQCLEEYKRCLSFLRSPIRKFPNETLLRIFEFAYDMNELTSKEVRTMPALAISGVCARWRSLARDHATLWSCIRMHIEGPYKHPSFPILDLYLECSRQSPLSVDLGALESNITQPQRLTVYTTLFKHTNQLKELMIRNNYTDIEAVLTSNGIPHFPILEKLDFPSYFSYFPNDLDLYQNTPNLGSLSFDAFSFVNIGESKLPWKQLTSLSLCGHPDGMKSLLETCSKLTELRLKEDSDLVFCQRCTPPAVAPVLEVLSLDLFRTSSLSKGLAEIAFSSLTCPTLTSLLVYGANGYERSLPKKSLHAFISRSSFHLTTLSIKSIPFSDSDLIKLLQGLPSLLHLTIHDHQKATPITPLLIRSLHAFPPASRNTPSSALVKKLQSLEMKFLGYDLDEELRDFSNRDFIDMISSRWFPDGQQADEYGHRAPDSKMGTACLRSVVMHFINREVDEEIYRPLKYLEKAGMRVIITGIVTVTDDSESDSQSD